jgi:site-specific recombinase XerD
MSDTELYQLISDNLTLSQALKMFLLAKTTEGVTAKTIRFYSMESGYFVAFAAQRNVTMLQDVTPDLLRQYLAMKGETRNKGGVHAAFRSLRALFLWYENEIEPDNWRNPIRKLKIPPHRPVPIPGVTMADYERLLAVCTTGGSTDTRDQALFRCLLDSCARATEFLNLNVGNVNHASGAVLILAGKGGDPRYVRFGNESRRRLRRYLRTRSEVNGEAPLFTTKKGERFTYDSLNSLVRWRSHQAGIPQPGLHDIRRAGALEMLRNGADLAFISKYLGHKAVEVTMRYLAITPDDIQIMHGRSGAVDHSLKRMR